MPIDGTQADQGRLPEAGLLPDSIPLDTKPPPDTKPPCSGLTCPLGCNTALDRCYRLQPSNFDVKPFFSLVTASLIGSGAQIMLNTDNGMITDGATVIRQANQPAVNGGIYWGTVPQAGYPDLSVFGMVSLKLPSGVIKVVGGKALAIYCTMDVNIAGTVVAPSSGSSPGAGGFAGGAKNGGDAATCFNGHGKGGKKVDPWHASGGGGGGRKADGGKGGDATTVTPNVVGGAGGLAVGNDTLIPLFGGCGGGGGGAGYEVGDGGAGGGGGGAIQIAASGSITISGKTGVPGAGGGASVYYGGGGGGGSGGAILLEAASITITGIIAANGGGGGGGGGNSSATDGQGGQASTSQATGGQPGQYGSMGGAGGALSPEGGSLGVSNTYEAGGGGGAAGRIRLNALPSKISVGANAASPTPSQGSSINLW